ncbi:polysaccharide deacetylase family protein [Streptomyces sp. CA-181903]|uniref:polysaccharide deacetylase family protein n=1 Tax=Streptomyces sp. CA-181903 TaxID=3240055 RepID=UPI003D91701E
MKRFIASVITTLAATATALTAVATTPAPTTTHRTVTVAASRPHASPLLDGSENRTFRTGRRLVALTFNAAWNTDGIGTVLAVLRQHHAPATFFLTGDFAERHPAAARSLAAAGHGIGNHSFSHPHFGELTPRERAAEVLSADRAIRAATGTAPLPFFRFPYGDTTPRQIAEVNALGFADIEFTTDTNGYLGPQGGMTVERTVRRVTDALRPGAIIQMHVGAPEGRHTVLDARALPAVLDALRSRGYGVADLARVMGGHADRPGPRASIRSGRRSRLSGPYGLVGPYGRRSGPSGQP